MLHLDFSHVESSGVKGEREGNVKKFLAMNAKAKEYEIPQAGLVPTGSWLTKCIDRLPGPESTAL